MREDKLTIQRPASALEPVATGERIFELDVLRGCALFGVLVAYALWSLGTPPAETYSSADRILNFLLAALIDTKAYTLFATMFGLGFSIQLTRASARGVSVVPVYCRRLMVLLLIGLAHALLLRNGDILVPYACMGFVLLLFRNASNRMLAIAAIAAVLFPYAARSLWDLTGIPYPERPDTTGMSNLASNLAWVRYWYATSIATWPASLPMFLIGFYLGRKRVLKNIEACRPVIRRVLIGGLISGVAAFALLLGVNALWADWPWPLWHRVTAGLLWSLHAAGLAAFYASSLLLLLQRRFWQRWLSPIGAVGRMALTNYLLQSMIIVPVCGALNLFDQVTPGVGLLLALGVWAFQVPASVWWLRHFQYGPAEWLWRSLTYGRAQRMRLRTAAVGANPETDLRLIPE
jgi:uncharacterized protein